MNAPVDAGLAEALASLGLRPDADARAVRRAYALQLKQIDQTTQLQEFQALRESYEFALGSITRRDAQPREDAPIAEPAETPSAADPHTAGFTPPDSAELAQAVFHVFSARAATTFKDEPDAIAALQDALSDDRLLNLEARTLFELQVARLIMNGWQPGHESLFGPACKAFNWERDRAHLRIFGQLGVALDTAISEQLIFFDRPAGESDRLGRVIHRLRSEKPPSPALLREDLHLVQLLVQRYPNWLRLVTSQDNVNAWFRQAADSAASASMATEEGPTVAANAVDDANQMKALSTALLMMFAVLVGVFVIFALGQGSGSAPASRPTATDSRRVSVAAQPASENLFYLGDAAFIRRDGQLIVEEVVESALGGAAPLRPGDKVLGCKNGDERIPLVLIAEAQRCGIKKGVSRQTGATTYTFNVLRDGHRFSASLLMPRGANSPPQMAVVEPPPQARHQPPDDPVRIGHVTFTRRDGALVVDSVGERTSSSFGTLQPGDRLLGCSSGSYHLPLIRPAEVRNCVATNGVNPQPGVTAYMFRVLRNRESVPASLTLRSPTSEPATAPESTLKLGTAN